MMEKCFIYWVISGDTEENMVVVKANIKEIADFKIQVYCEEQSKNIAETKVDWESKINYMDQGTEAVLI